MTDADELHTLGAERVTRFHESDRHAGDERGPSVRWQDYHSARNSALGVLRPFGTVGPMGVARITADEVGPLQPWPVETLHPQFFIVDDMWNDRDRYVKVEVEDPHLISLDVLHALRMMLRQKHPDWEYILAGFRGYVRITPDAFLVRDTELTGCSSVGEVVRLLSGEQGEG